MRPRSPPPRLRYTTPVAELDPEPPHPTLSRLSPSAAPFVLVAKPTGHESELVYVELPTPQTDVRGLVHERLRKRVQIKPPAGSAAATTTANQAEPSTSAAHKPRTVRTLAAATAVEPSTPLELVMRVGPTSLKRAAEARDQAVIIDSGSGVSLGSKSTLRSLGAVFTKSPFPVFINGVTPGEAFADEIATVQLSIGDYSKPYTFWSLPDSAITLLVGRDNMRAADGKQTVINPDTDHPWVQFNDDKRQPATVVHNDSLAAISTLQASWNALAARCATATTLRSGSFDTVSASFAQSPGSDLHVRQATTGSLYVPDQAVRVDANGRADVLLLNFATTPTTICQGDAVAAYDRIAPSPLHASTLAAHARRGDQATVEPESSNFSCASCTASFVCQFQRDPGNEPEHHAPELKVSFMRDPPLPPVSFQRERADLTVTPTTDTTTTTGPLSASAAHQVLFAERKPTESGQLRGASWTGSEFESSGEASATFESKASEVTEASLDNALLAMRDNAAYGTRKQRRRLLKILRKHAKRGLFSTKEHPVGSIVGHKHSFKRKSDQPVFCPPFRKGPKVDAELIRQADKMLEQGALHPTTPPNNFPALLVSKGPGKEPRLCLDMREWNKTLITEFFEIPNIKGMLAELGRHRIFSSVDQAKGYWSVVLADDDGDVPSAHQLAFTLPDGRRLAFKRLVMGVTDAAFTFQRIMASILAQHHGYVNNYIDDTFIFNGKRGEPLCSAIDAHITHIDEVFTSLVDAGAKISPSKTSLLQDTAHALGHVVHDHRIRLDPAKFDAIQRLRTPETQVELQQAMGLLGISRTFTPGFAAIAAPLNDLIKADHRSFRSLWGTEHDKAFQALKDRFSENAEVSAPDYSKPFEVWADASDVACGAMLVQRNAHGLPRIIECQSHKFTATERRYTVTERECLAILLGCKQFRSHLLVSNRFTVAVRSDHRGLIFLHRNTDTNSKLFRWAQSLSEFDYNIEYVPGKDNVATDALSRLAGWVTATVAVMHASRTGRVTTAVAGARFNRLWCFASAQTETYIIARFVHRWKLNNGRVFYRVRWQGHGSDQDTVEPLSELRKSLSPANLKWLQDEFDTRNAATVASDAALDNHADAPAEPTAAAPPSGQQHSPTQPLSTPVANHPSVPFHPEITPDHHVFQQVTIAQVAAHQRKDAKIKALIDAVGAPGSNKAYKIVNTVLVKTFAAKTGVRTGSTVSVIVLPESLVKLALAATHDAEGHHGCYATEFAMQTRFTFKHMVARTRRYVKGCKHCGRAKRDARPVQLAAIPTFKFLHTVCIDFTARFTIPDADGNHCLAVIVDESCKLVHVVPTKADTVVDATKAMLSFIQHYGLMQHIHSDRGNCFTSKIWGSLLKYASIKRALGTSMNPQGDGIAEANVGNIKGLIRSACERQPRHWGEAGKWAAWTYNRSFHSTIGTTPFFAVFGREPRMITDLIFQQPDADEPVSLAQLINRINSTHRYTKNRILKQQSKFTKRTVNRAHKFADGDDVWIARNFPGTKRTGTNKSFFWPFRPDVYEITEVLSPQTLRVRRKATNTRAHGKSGIMHTRRVKPCRPQVDAFDYADMSPYEIDLDAEDVTGVS